MLYFITERERERQRDFENSRIFLRFFRNKRGVERRLKEFREIIRVNPESED